MDRNSSDRNAAGERADRNFMVSFHSHIIVIILSIIIIIKYILGLYVCYIYIYISLYLLDNIMIIIITIIWEWKLTIKFLSARSAAACESAEFLSICCCLHDYIESGLRKAIDWLYSIQIFTDIPVGSFLSLLFILTILAILAILAFLALLAIRTEHPINVYVINEEALNKLQVRLTYL